MSIMENRQALLTQAIKLSEAQQRLVALADSVRDVHKAINLVVLGLPAAPGARYMEIRSRLDEINTSMHSTRADMEATAQLIKMYASSLGQ